jgi:hypothetical protein
VAADRAGAGAAGLDRELLPDATDTVNVATDREVADFLAEHTTGDRLDELVGGCYAAGVRPSTAASHATARRCAPWSAR